MSKHTEASEGSPGGPGNLKAARGGLSLAPELLPGPPRLPSGSPLGSLKLPQRKCSLEKLSKQTEEPEEAQEDQGTSKQLGEGPP